MLVFPVLGLFYAVMNQPIGMVHSLSTKLDDAIPFIHYFSLPYSVWIFYIYACLIYFFMKDPRVYHLTLASYVASALICYIIFYFYQTTVARPILTGDDLFTKLLAFIYGRDEPYNCFPSIHCFSSYLVMKALFKSGFRNIWNQTLIYGMSVTIILSTLFIKQHVVMDVVGAVLLVEVVYWALYRAYWAERALVSRVHL